MTRQFTVTGSGDEALSQLHLTMRFDQLVTNEAVESGHRWCHSRDEVSEFEQWVKGTQTYRSVQSQRPKLVELTWSQV